MKITRLQAENIKRLVAVEINPEGNVVLITGENGAGKSSVLDSIYWALAGKKAHQPQPIRTGEDKATITLELGDIVVRREFKRDSEGDRITTKLVVENAEGARYPSPQDMLDDMLESLAFDPLAFANAKPEKQYAILRGFVTSVNWDDEEKANQMEYGHRRDINREVAALEAKLGDSLENLAELETLPDEDILKKMASIKTIQEANAIQEKGRLMLVQNINAMQELGKGDLLRIGRLRQDIERSQADIQRLENEIKSVDGDQEIRRTAIVNDREKIKAIPEPEEVPDIAELQEGLDSVRAHNDRVKMLTEARAKQAKSDELTKGLDDRKERLKKAVEDADMPAPGLELTDSQVFLDGAPIVQASEAQKYRLSGAIMIKLNPKLRVVLVRNASLIDEKGMAFYQELADKHDFQFWMERVDTSGKVGFFIEDGSLVLPEEGQADMLEDTNGKQ